MNKHFIFIGGVWDKTTETEIINNSKGSVQIAANNLQWEIIKGIELVSESVLTIINSYFIGAFPLKYAKPIIKSFPFNHSNVKGHIDYNIGFLNIPLYKHFSRFFHKKKYLRKALKDIEGDTYIIGYSMSYSIVRGLLYAKKKNSNIKTCLIVPDLPEYMNLGNNNLLSGCGRKILNDYLYKKIKEIDSFVVLTEAMYDRLGVGDKKHVVVEGIAPEIDIVKEPHKEKEIKRILYTGSLGIKYGICDLVDAFVQIEGANLRLTICGYGDGEEYIRKKANIDTRIEFLGTVNVNRARDLQKSAYLLVNPRKNNEEYTKYSFPSKTLEYMMSGRPILMYKLEGMPREYDDFLFYVKEDIVSSLKTVLSLEPFELEEKGKAAQQFVLNKKNKNVQASKIVSMLYEM